MGKCCNLLTIFMTQKGGANVNHSTNPSTRKVNLANFFLLWTQPSKSGCEFSILLAYFQFYDILVKIHGLFGFFSCYIS